MAYSEHLHKLFPAISLVPEDLLLLERFQIKYLPDRVPKKEFAALLQAYPLIHKFIVSKYPPIEKFIDKVFRETKPLKDSSIIEDYCQKLLWEIGEMIIYNKYPEVYDSNVKFNWKINEIIDPDLLAGKTIIDAGSGSGQLAFLLAPFVDTVYAVEPLESFRQFIREKAKKKKLDSIYVVDGFLDSLPFIENYADILLTSNAIGWNINKELKEIECKVKPGGFAIHLMRTIGNKDENPLHEVLTSEKWSYAFSKSENKNGLKIKYSKTIKK